MELLKEWSVGVVAVFVGIALVVAGISGGMTLGPAEFAVDTDFRQILLGSFGVVIIGAVAVVRFSAIKAGAADDF